MTEKKTKTISLRVIEEDYNRIREAALDQRYMNFSQFVRDAIEEKIDRFDVEDANAGQLCPEKA